MSAHLLPPFILAQASSHGREYAWRPADIPQVLAAAHDCELAVTDADVQLHLPGCVYELPGHDLAPAPRQPAESWPAYVARSHADVLVALYDLPPFDELVAFSSILRDGDIAAFGEVFGQQPFGNELRALRERGVASAQYLRLKLTFMAASDAMP